MPNGDKSIIIYMPFTSTIIVEDGSIVTGANSFVDLAFANSYFESDLYAHEWTLDGDERREKALKMAARYIYQNFKFDGELVEKDQPMYFPRTGVINPDTGDEYLETEIPLILKQAQCEMALFLLTNDVNALKSQGNAVKREKADVVEVEYFNDKSRYQSFSDKALKLLLQIGKVKGGYTKQVDRS